MKLFPLLFTIFIDSLGFGLVFPLLSPLIMDPAGILATDTSPSMKGWILGILISSFCLGQFIGGPVLGALSDRKGRKPIICLTLVIAMLSYIMAGASVCWASAVGLIIARTINGISAGNFAVAQSMVADMSSDAHKSKNFGLIGMAWGVGFILGPYIGGHLAGGASGDICDFAVPFWVAAVLCGVNWILATVVLRESNTILRTTPLTLLGGVRDLRRAFSHVTLRGVFITTFIFSLGWGFFIEFSAFFLMHRFSFGPEQIGNFYAYAGLWVALCQGWLIRPLLKRYPPKELLRFAFFVLGVMLLVFLSSASPSILLIGVPLIAFPESLVYPNAAALISSLSRSEEQGEMLGIHNSVQWAAIGLIPLFSGSLVALYPHLPIAVASTCMFIALGVFAWFMKRIPDSSLKDS